MIKQVEIKLAALLAVISGATLASAGTRGVVEQ